MGNDPLNQLRYPNYFEKIADLLRSVIEGRTATYVSVPITTGPLFLRWFKERGAKLDPASHEYREEHYRSVILPNLEHARNRILELRRESSKIVIDPTAFEPPEWTQDEYRYFWGKVIEHYVNIVVFLDGWQYSSGCCFEFLTATRCGADTITENKQPIGRETGIELITAAIQEIKQYSMLTTYLDRVVRELYGDATRLYVEPTTIEDTDWTKQPGALIIVDQLHLKDTVLDRLAVVANVAQFVSIGPNGGPTQRFSRIRGFEPNFKFTSPETAISSLLESSPDGTVNIRRFQAEQVKGEQFWYGLKTVDAVIEILRQNAAEGKYSIVNETIDVNDGGVSGVAIDRILEFSPGDTPKCVDKPGVCTLPRDIAMHVLNSVYGFRPALNFDTSVRVEFSIHPRKRGFRCEHTIIWELEDVGEFDLQTEITWPNNFSQFIGDKAYGLLVADAIDLPVPKTTVITRSIAPFTFGQQTGTLETWMRTCPEVRVPGKYPTKYGWYDPFKLMTEEDRRAEDDPKRVRIASVLAQEAVRPVYSGSLLPKMDEQPFIEGVHGRGDEFMLGRAAPEPLPTEVIKAVTKLYSQAFKRLGPVEMEWVYDGQMAWVIQISKSVKSPVGDTIFHGKPKIFHRFEVGKGLESLRDLVSRLKGSSEGIILVGDIGITSHFGDILRKAKIPSRIERLRKYQFRQQSISG
jgi:hypothetical protein